MIYIMKHRQYDNPVPKGYIELGIGDLFKYKDKDNINELNLYVNEVEGLYYIWKNCDDEIVGLNHYRRIFVNNGDYLKLKDAEKILKDYDMIITNDVVFRRSIYDQLKMELENPDIYDKYFKKFCNAIPGLKEFFNKDRFNNREMFVCKRKLMNKYCEWLFPIIMPIIKEFIENDADRVINKRMLSHIIERVFSFWIQKNNLKCYRMEYKDIPERKEGRTMVKVKCVVQMLNDLDAKKTRKYGEEFIVTDERAKYLSGDNANKIKAVEILEVIPDKEEKPEKVEEKPKKVNKKQTKKIDKKK